MRIEFNKKQFKKNLHQFRLDNDFESLKQMYSEMWIPEWTMSVICAKWQMSEERKETIENFWIEVPTI